MREEVDRIPEGTAVIATGPLTSPALSEDLQGRFGQEHLYFYDAIAPIVTADSIDQSIAFRASRYDKGGDDYINFPFTSEEYYAFVDAIMAAEKVPTRDFERCVYFEGCMPIEEMARRGRDTLAFGPMRPVGLIDPRTGQRPFAVAQARQDDARGTLYNLVGFQTKMTYPEQRRVFRMVPGLEKACVRPPRQPAPQHFHQLAAGLASDPAAARRATMSSSPDSWSASRATSNPPRPESSPASTLRALIAGRTTSGAAADDRTRLAAAPT